MLKISIGDAIRHVLENQPSCELAQNMQQHLSKGLTVPDELAVQALEVNILDMRCQTRGYGLKIEGLLYVPVLWPCCCLIILIKP